MNDVIEMSGGGRAAFVALLAAIAFAGCTVDPTGAACIDDTSCLSGQHCVSGRCGTAPTGASTGGSSGSAGSTSGSSTSAGSSGSHTASSGSASSSGGSSGSACSTGPNAGDGCATAGATECDPSLQRVLKCQPADGGCNAWKPAALGDCSAVMLVCIADASGARCACSPPSGAAVIADATISPIQLVAPSGAMNPAICRFRNLGPALAAAVDAGGLVEAVLPPTWTSRTITIGERVRPTLHSPTRGYYFTATQGGVGQLTEPTWVTDGGSIMDGLALWVVGGSTAFASDDFPVVVPSGVTLETSACPYTTPFSTPCPPDDFLLAVPPTPADPALHLYDGTAVAGFGIVDLRAAGSTVYCAEGAVALQSVDLLTANDAGIGLNVAGQCTATAEGVGIVGYETAVSISAAGGQVSTLDQVALGISAAAAAKAGVPSGNGVGLLISAGQANLLDSSVMSNGVGIDARGGSLFAFQSAVEQSTEVGVRVEGGALAFWDGGIGDNGDAGTSVDGVLVRSVAVGPLGDGGTGPSPTVLAFSTITRNSGRGVAIEPNHDAIVELAADVVSDNGESGVDFGANPNNFVEAGVLLFTAVSANGTKGVSGRMEGLRVGGPTYLVSVGSSFFSNPGAQVSFSSAAPPGAPYDLSSASCGVDGGAPNAVYCYSGTNGNVGVLAGTGASVTANNLIWANDPPIPGVDYGSTGTGTMNVPLESCSAATAVCP